MNEPETLAVTINPSSAGVHSAVLNLDDPTTPGIDYQTMNTVVVRRRVHCRQQLHGHEDRARSGATRR